MLTISPIAAFEDNYIWLLDDGTDAIVVDPGQAGPVIDALAAKPHLSLTTILLTHHHGDHVDGAPTLHARYKTPIYAARSSNALKATGLTICPLDDRDRLDLPSPTIDIEIFAVPGHTMDHLAYYVAEAKALFSGDTLFGCGCGRLFGGTPTQMLASLDRLADLPDDTKIYSGHEYTQSNIAFARLVEPDSVALRHRAETTDELRRQGLPTQPSTLAEEKATNPFLRVREPTVIAAASRRAGKALTDPVEVFATLREWKDMR